MIEIVLIIFGVSFFASLVVGTESINNKLSTNGIVKEVESIGGVYVQSEKFTKKDLDTIVPNFIKESRKNPPFMKRYHFVEYSMNGAPEKCVAEITMFYGFYSSVKLRHDLI